MDPVLARAICEGVMELGARAVSAQEWHSQEQGRQQVRVNTGYVEGFRQGHNQGRTKGGTGLEGRAVASCRAVIRGPAIT